MVDIQVQHLIEKCICYKLNKEECMETLEKHAKIMPVITSTGMLLALRVFFLLLTSNSALVFPLHYSCKRFNQDSRVVFDHQNYYQPYH